MSQGGQLPDLYKFPPTELQSYDDWRKQTACDGNADGGVTDLADVVADRDGDVPELLFTMESCLETNVDFEPEPDYSDSDDNDDVSESSPSDVVRRQTSKDDTEEKRQSLSKDDYDKIIAATEAQLGINIPEPDYQDDDDDDEQIPNGGNPSLENPYMAHVFMPPENSEDEIITPKKLPNPCLESREKKDLHRELLMNQKLGIDVLHKKCELKKKLEERREAMKKKELEEHVRSKRTSLEVRLEEQANKLKTVDGGDKKKKEPLPSQDETSEFIKVHSKIKRSHVES